MSNIADLIEAYILRQLATQQDGKVELRRRDGKLDERVRKEDVVAQVAALVSKELGKQEREAPVGLGR